jgi:hypothetical protein
VFHAAIINSETCVTHIAGRPVTVTHTAVLEPPLTHAESEHTAETVLRHSRQISPFGQQVRCKIIHGEWANLINITGFIGIGDTRYRSLLRHYATARKVAGSIPDEVIAFFFQFT